MLTFYFTFRLELNSPRIYDSVLADDCTITAVVDNYTVILYEHPYNFVPRYIMVKIYYYIMVPVAGFRFLQLSYTIRVLVCTLICYGLCSDFITIYYAYRTARNAIFGFFTVQDFAVVIGLCGTPFVMRVRFN